MVPEDSFTGLNCDQLYLDLSSNSMRGLHPDAFRGVEEKITFLKLENNQLQSLPIALTNLTNLILLDIHDNPITTFEYSVISSLGSHLQMLHVGSMELTDWPQELAALNSLQALRVYHLQLKDLPAHAFKGFEDTLTTLEINSTNLSGVPDAVCYLTNVNSLIFVNNSNVQSDDVMPNCTDPVYSMFSVKMDNNNLLSFPDVFSAFPNIVQVSVTSNPNITSVDSTIPINSKVSHLTLYSNNIAEVPAGIRNCSNLKILDLKGNNISEVNDMTFDDVDQLLFIDLSHNPLAVLNEYAFANMTLLNHVALDNTQLPNLPEAIKSLESIRVVDYRNNQVNCKCSELGWLGNMTLIDTVDIKGLCTKTLPGEPVNTFINLKLDNC